MDHRRNIYNKVSTGISLLTMFLCSWVCFSCSTTKGVPEGDQLFVGLTKIDYQDYERNSNFIDTQVKKAGAGYALCFGDTEIAVDKPELTPYEGKTVVLGVRPEDLHAEPQFFEKNNVINAYIDLDEMMGAESYLYLEYAGQKMIARVPARYAKKAEENIELAIDVETIHLFDKETEKAI